MKSSVFSSSLHLSFSVHIFFLSPSLSLSCLFCIPHAHIYTFFLLLCLSLSLALALFQVDLNWSGSMVSTNEPTTLMMLLINITPPRRDFYPPEISFAHQP